MRPATASSLARVLPVLTAAVLLMSACVTTAAPGWTFEPAPSPTATPVASGSAVPSASASGSVAPSASASVGPSASGGGATIDIAASGIAFDQSSLTAPAGQAFQIVFQNNDASVQHDVQIKDGGGNSVFKGDLVTGVASVTYNVPALPAGSYTFDCIVHPAMTGTLTVK